MLTLMMMGEMGFDDWDKKSGMRLSARRTWITVLNNLVSHNLTLTEVVNMAQNCLLQRLLAASGAMYSQSDMHGQCSGGNGRN